VQPPFPSQASTVQAIPSSQLYGVPTQTPLLQVSPNVHAFPSSQLKPVNGVKTQPPCPSHASDVH
jgi:hypothetical protein